MCPTREAARKLRRLDVDRVSPQQWSGAGAGGWARGGCGGAALGMWVGESTQREQPGASYAFGVSAVSVLGGVRSGLRLGALDTSCRLTGGPSRSNEAGVRRARLEVDCLCRAGEVDALRQASIRDAEAHATSGNRGRHPVPGPPADAAGEAGMRALLVAGGGRSPIGDRADGRDDSPPGWTFGVRLLEWVVDEGARVASSGVRDQSRGHRSGRRGVGMVRGLRASRQRRGTQVEVPSDPPRELENSTPRRRDPVGQFDSSPRRADPAASV